ncbi:hypothetical protein FE257_002031 [Aspergillus nanangensis]|uniref:Heterokaryon incompatibility domain-containing protein n=1 Tax=Aspergillus nanangensis TaxID=2582783 RepID=A0AAD4CT60_ASPNN|nr:hypothetical protein FE257_002031 [Aspergillus nanangensis]
MGCFHSKVPETSHPLQSSRPSKVNDPGKEGTPVPSHIPNTYNCNNLPGTSSQRLGPLPVQQHADTNRVAVPSRRVETTAIPPPYNITLTEQQRQLLAVPLDQRPRLVPGELQSFNDLYEALTLDEIYETDNSYRRHVPIHENVPYVYEPLPTPTSIRLLDILPEDDSGMIRCSITVVDLEQSPVPKYSCLSYTWGNPLARGVGLSAFDEAEQSGEYDSQNIAISCNGRLFHIRRNLFDALKQLPVYPDTYLRSGHLKNMLHGLAEQGRTSMLFTWLLDGAPPNVMDGDGKTPLHYAAANGHFDAADVLLKTGADATQLDYNSKTPVDYSIENNHLTITDLILNFTPERRIRMPTGNERRQNPTPTYLWVDAICINQEDIEERTSQVNMMDQIFRSSENTIGWLGREDKHTEMAMQTIVKLYPYLEQLFHSDIRPYFEASPEDYSRQGVPYISMAEWESLASIYLRQWFQRIWVLQEVTLAQGIVCFCGPYELPMHFAMLTRTLEAMDGRGRQYPGSARYIPSTGAAISIHANFAQMLDCREKRILDQSTLEHRAMSTFFRGPGKKCQSPLTRLVLNFWTFQSTDPRDKVFALLAIARGDPDSPDILADYSLPVERVYADITKQMIVRPFSTQMPLHILSLVNINPKIITLPSWVPDYSIPGVQPLSDLSFTAAGSLSPSIAWCPHTVPWNHLSLRGFRIATITGASSKRDVLGRATKYGFDPSWFELMYTVQAPYPTGQPLSEVLWRTLCTDHDIKGDLPAPMRLGHQFRDFVCAQMLADADTVVYRMQESLRESGIYTMPFTIESPYPSWLEDLVASEGEGNSFIPTISQVREFANNPKFRIWNPRTESFLPPPAGEDDFMHAFGKVFGLRRLFTAGEGGAGNAVFLGMGSRNLEPGDEVWVLPGSRVPYILRPLGNGEYRFVGDAEYLDIDDWHPRLGVSEFACAAASDELTPPSEGLADVLPGRLDSGRRSL